MLKYRFSEQRLLPDGFDFRLKSAIITVLAEWFLVDEGADFEEESPMRLFALPFFLNAFFLLVRLCPNLYSRDSAES